MESTLRWRARQFMAQVLAAVLLGVVGVGSLQATGAAPAAATGACASGGYGCYSIVTTPPTRKQAPNIGLVTPNVESGVAVQTVTAPSGENLSPWSFASYDSDTISYTAPDSNDQISVYAQVGVAPGQLPGCFTSSGGPMCQVLTQFPVGSYGCASGSCQLQLGITGGTAGTADYFEAWIFNSSGSPLYCGGIWEIDWQATTQASASASLSASPTTTGSSASVSGSSASVSGYGAVTFVAVVSEAGVACDSPPPGPGICGIGVEVNGTPVAEEVSGGTAYVANPNGSIPASVSVTAYYVTCGYSYTSGPEQIYDSYCGCYTAGPEPSVTDTWYGVAQGVGVEAPDTGTWSASDTANGAAGASSPSPPTISGPSATCSVTSGNGPSVVTGGTTCTVYTTGRVGFTISDPDVTSTQFLQVGQQNACGLAWCSDGVGGGYGATSASGSVPAAATPWPGELRVGDGLGAPLRVSTRLPEDRG